MLQSFSRAFALLSILIASGLFVGCGGPGAPVSGGSDPATEAAAAALAPEGGPGDSEEGAANVEAPKEAAESDTATEPAAEDSNPAPAPESKK